MRKTQTAQERCYVCGAPVSQGRVLIAIDNAAEVAR